MLEYEKRIIWELIYSDKNQENGFPKTYFKGMLDVVRTNHVVDLSLA